MHRVLLVTAGCVGFAFAGVSMSLFRRNFADVMTLARINEQESAGCEHCAGIAKERSHRRSTLSAAREQAQEQSDG